VLPVLESRGEKPPVRTGTGAAPNGRPARDVVGVPVRLQAESSRESVPPAAAVLVPTDEGNFWHDTVGELVAREAVTALVRELALQSQLVGRDDGHWMLRVERESLNQPTSRERLQNALQAAGHTVKLSIEVGTVSDSPARRNAAAAAEQQRAAEELILADPFVQDMMRDFGAKIVPGSVKPAANR
jgi:DNA polymerase-3 subunit gamma/tau